MSSISLGLIIKPHGLKGTLKVVPAFELLNEHAIEEGDEFFVDDRSLILESLEYQPQGFLVKFKDIDSIESAEALRGKRIYFPATPPRYPAKGFYMEELIGFGFIEKDSKQTGHVRDVYETGAHFNLSLESKAGKSFDVPMIPQFVKNVDLKAKILDLDLAKLEL